MKIKALILLVLGLSLSCKHQQQTSQSLNQLSQYTLPERDFNKEVIELTNAKGKPGFSDVQKRVCPHDFTEAEMDQIVESDSRRDLAILCGAILETNEVSKPLKKVELKNKNCSCFFPNEGRVVVFNVSTIKFPQTSKDGQIYCKKLKYHVMCEDPPCDTKSNQDYCQNDHIACPISCLSFE